MGPTDDDPASGGHPSGSLRYSGGPSVLPVDAYGPPKVWAEKSAPFSEAYPEGPRNDRRWWEVLVSLSLLLFVSDGAGSA